MISENFRLASIDKSRSLALALIFATSLGGGFSAAQASPAAGTVLIAKADDEENRVKKN
jgi:hypothetical protein